MKNTKSLAFAGALLGAMTLISPAVAGDLRAKFSECVNKFANPHKNASVMLECTAGGGKLSDCKMVDGPTPSEGFDQAAICVASELPVGDKTGQLKVPIKFVSI